MSPDDNRHADNATANKFLAVIHSIISGNFDLSNTIRAIMVFYLYLQRDVMLVNNYRPKELHLKALNLEGLVK